MLDIHCISTHLVVALRLLCSTFFNLKTTTQFLILIECLYYDVLCQYITFCTYYSYGHQPELVYECNLRPPFMALSSQTHGQRRGGKGGSRILAHPW